MSKKTRPSYKTDAPRLSDATIARIRAAAHRYVRGGGSIFPSLNDGDRDHHIGNVRELVRPGESDRLEAVLTTHTSTHEAHEALWSAAWNLVTATEDAGFLFGAFVGFEVAALSGHHMETPKAKAVRR